MIVIEAKYQTPPVEATQFTRLCYIIEHKFDNNSCLGVFFSDSGASGMSNTGSLQHARAAQVIFHARTKKYVVVLDRNDILELVHPGALLRILRSKIWDVEANANISYAQYSNMQWLEVKLPQHLAKHLTPIQTLSL